MGDYYVIVPKCLGGNALRKIVIVVSLAFALLLSACNNEVDVTVDETDASAFTTVVSAMAETIILTETSEIVPVETAKTELWRDAYADFLRNVETYSYAVRSEIIPGSYNTPPLFCLYDIDKNQIPEIILITDDGNWENEKCEVFTYDNSDVKLLGEVKFNWFGNVSSPLNRAEGLFSDNGYKGQNGEIYYYTIKNGALVEQLVCEYNYRPDYDEGKVYTIIYLYDAAGNGDAVLEYTALPLNYESDIFDLISKISYSEADPSLKCTVLYDFRWITEENIEEVINTPTIPIVEMGMVEKAKEKTVKSVAYDRLYKGMLYDFNFDNVPEYSLFYSDESGCPILLIYMYDYDDWHHYAELYISNHTDDGLLYVDLYYDAVNKRYFYSSIVFGVVKDVGEPVYCGFLCESYFENNQMLKETILSLECEIDDEQRKNEFILQCEEYLSQYEHIKTIPIEPMWTKEDIESGEYEEIIRKAFAEYGIYD
jgi:hypothetical protein